MEIAKRLRNARELSGKSQTQVSKDTGINNKTLSGYERGVSEPDLQTFNLLSQYYKVSLEYLLGNSDIKNPYKEDNLPDEFTTPEESIKFMLSQQSIMGYVGFDIDKLTDEQKIDFANELLGQLKLLSYKYKK